MDAAHRGPERNWTPAVSIGVPLLVTWIIVSDTFNLPGALTHWVYENEGFTPHQTGILDWILNNVDGPANDNHIDGLPETADGSGIIPAPEDFYIDSDRNLSPDAQAEIKRAQEEIAGAKGTLARRNNEGFRDFLTNEVINKNREYIRALRSGAEPYKVW